MPPPRNCPQTLYSVRDSRQLTPTAHWSSSKQCLKIVRYPFSSQVTRDHPPFLQYSRCRKYLQLMTTCWQPAPAARPTFVTLRRSLEQQGELLNPEKLKPRDIGQFAPRSTSGPSAAMLKFDPEEQSRASNLIEDLQMPRDELIVINELGAGDFYQLVLMEMTSGLTGL